MVIEGGHPKSFLLDNIISLDVIEEEKPDVPWWKKIFNVSKGEQGK